MSITASKFAVVKTPQNTRPKVIAPPRKGGYRYSPFDFTNKVSGNNISIPLDIDTEFSAKLRNPANVDYSPLSRQPITTQIKGIYQKEGAIFCSPRLPIQYRRHEAVEFDFHPVHYLKHCGYDVDIFKQSRKFMKDLPVCEFVLYAHFAIAEMHLIVEGEFEKDIEKLLLTNSASKPRLEMTRRLRAVTPTKFAEHDYVDLDWQLTMDGIDYAVRLSVFDTCALHGMASYKDLAEATGVVLYHKDNFTSDEKAEMLKWYAEGDTRFEPYALGDLYPYDFLVHNASNFMGMYDTLGIREYYKDPKLTIGATVRDLFLARLYSVLGIDASDKQGQQELIERYLTPASAQHLRVSPHRTQALLAKCEGGRCRNNRPTHIQHSRHSVRFLGETREHDYSVVQLRSDCEVAVYLHNDKPLCDLDISGCYGEGQRNQRYFVGKPEVMDFESTSSYNDYPSLGEWLKAYNGELDDDNWFVRVTFDGVLKLPQDLLASWFDMTKGADLLAAAKYACEAPSDTEQQEYEDTQFDEEDGRLKIFNHVVYNATITASQLDAITHLFNAHQRKELMDKLKVVASAVYPLSWQVDTYQELQQAYEKHKGRNTTKRIGRGKKAIIRRDEAECHAWIGFNLGELLIDDLIANRKLHPKKTPLNTLYKLCVNTLYGDMTSKFFASANVVVGNNITARARVLAWLMEKGLNGWQTITDGCVFDINRVVYPVPGKSFSAQGLVNMYRLTDRELRTDRNILLQPLGGYDKHEINWLGFSIAQADGTPKLTYYPELVSYKGDEVHRLTPIQNAKGEVSNPAMDWINTAAMEHLQRLFSDVRILHAPSTSLKPTKGDDGKPVKNYLPRVGQFEFEAKDFYSAGSFHSSANYLLFNPNGYTLKMRSYETKKEHWSFDGEITPEGVVLVPTERYGKDNNPAKDLMTAILYDPTAVPRQEPFIKATILKPGDRRQNSKRFEPQGLNTGDSYHKQGLLRELSLSQLVMRTFDQWKQWDKTVTSDKEKTGQSLERYFIDAMGNVNLQALLSFADKSIAEGATNPYQLLDPHYNLGRTPHPKYHVLKELESRIKAPKQEQ